MFLLYRVNETGIVNHAELHIPFLLDYIFINVICHIKSRLQKNRIKMFLYINGTAALCVLFRI